VNVKQGENVTYKLVIYEDTPITNDSTIANESSQLVFDYNLLVYGSIFKNDSALFYMLFTLIPATLQTQRLVFTGSDSEGRQTSLIILRSDYSHASPLFLNYL